MSGSVSTRGLRLATQMAEVLQVEASRCAPQDRPEVDRAITGAVRHGCAEAAHARLEYGARPDEETFAALARIRSRDPVVLGTRAAFALPAPFDRRVLAVARAARRAVRRMAPR
jgi:hypothetical protein